MIRFFFVFLFLVTTLAGWEGPWYERAFEIRKTIAPGYVSYQNIDSSRGTLNSSSDECHLDMAVGTNLLDLVEMELEVGFCDTRQHSFNLRDISFAARTVWLSDCVGDWVSLATGIDVTQNNGVARRDFSTFTHGGIEGEGHLSIGKEFICHDRPLQQYWVTAAYGIGDVGSPWWRFYAAGKWYFSEQQHLIAFTQYRFGTGNHPLTPSFHGYGPISYRALDLGVTYTYSAISLSAQIRAYAHNCPRTQTTLFLVFHF
ncbi:MAG: hypothetical protein KDK65_03395 [Chlamydiia bacterium]|nr:hypothetical protein [Chlamydiia bacterium]